MPLSEHFIEAFCKSGTIVAECNFCGRVHFVREGDYDTGELEDLRQRAKENPDKYIESGENYVGVIDIDGRVFIVGCLCEEKKLVVYENFLWNHAHSIAVYFRKRATAEYESAKHQKQALENIPIPIGNKEPLAVVSRRRIDLEEVTISVPKVKHKKVIEDVGKENASAENV